MTLPSVFLMTDSVYLLPFSVWCPRLNSARSVTSITSMQLDHGVQCEIEQVWYSIFSSCHSTVPYSGVLNGKKYKWLEAVLLLHVEEDTLPH